MVQYHLCRAILGLMWLESLSVHVPVSSVIIHKSVADAPENMRRGNTRDDLIVEAMLVPL